MYALFILGGTPVSILKNIKTTYKYNGIPGIFRKIKYKFTNGYGHFLRTENKPTWEEMILQDKALVFRPKLSAIIPVYQPDLWQLVQCVDSVLGQPYREIEVVLSLDGLLAEEVEKYIQQISQKDSRIIVIFSERNEGISSASNKAVKKATGEYIFLLDQDDMLAANAIIEIVTALQEKRYDFIYTDEDMIDERNKRFSPQFKPDWSPHTLLSRMYVNHLSVYKKQHVDTVGGFRSAYDGSQDFDLLLRASRNFEIVKHIPKVLYHWRTSKNSIATNIENKSYIFEKAQSALEDYFRANEIETTVEPHCNMLIYNFDIRPKDNPLVSILIPFKDGVELTLTLLESIEKYAGYDHFEIILINNKSNEKTIEHLKKYCQNSQRNICIQDANYDFNYAKLNNQAVKKANGAYILFLNNDIEWFEENTLRKMLGIMELKDVGAVGCKLLYPNNTIQHAGVIMGYHEIAGHIGVGQHKDEAGYYGRNLSLFNTSAVTAASLLVKRVDFNQVGGFDETLAVAYQDVDLCLKLLRIGKYNVYVGNIQMYHHESVTRGFDDVASKRYQNECRIMQERYADLIENDPYYNPNLSIKVGELFRVKGK